jgi:hypothetical protein
MKLPLRQPTLVQTPPQDADQNDTRIYRTHVQLLPSRFGVASDWDEEVSHEAHGLGRVRTTSDATERCRLALDTDSKPSGFGFCLYRFKIDARVPDLGFHEISYAAR